VRDLRVARSGHVVHCTSRPVTRHQSGPHVAGPWYERQARSSGGALLRGPRCASSIPDQHWARSAPKALGYGGTPSLRAPSGVDGSTAHVRSSVRTPVTHFTRTFQHGPRQQCIRFLILVRDREDYCVAAVARSATSGSCSRVTAKLVPAISGTALAGMGRKLHSGRVRSVVVRSDLCDQPKRRDASTQDQPSGLMATPSPALLSRRTLEAA
jgi:hypothetical protein